MVIFKVPRKILLRLTSLSDFDQKMIFGKIKSCSTKASGLDIENIWEKIIKNKNVKNKPLLPGHEKRYTLGQIF